MEFLEYYESLQKEERQLTRKRLTKACIIEPSTWYSWIQKKAIPKPSQKLIALELGQDMNELFPNN